MNQDGPALPLRYLLFVAAVGTIAFAPSLPGGFLCDDFGYIARFWSLPMAEWPRLFVREWSEGLWGFPLFELRPVTALSFMIDARLHGGDALGYRLTNLVLHLANACLVMKIAHRASRGSTLAGAVAGLAFVLHATAVEPTAWITGRVDSLATMFALAFWLSATGFAERGGIPRATIAILAFAAGIFGKEFCLLALVLLILWWALVERPADATGWRRRIILVIGTLVVLAIYAWCRRIAFGSGATRTFGGWDDPGVWARQASYLGWITGVFPAIDVREVPLPLPLPWMRVSWLLIVASVACLLAWARWKSRPGALRAIFFSMLWYLAATGILLVVGYFSPRHLYFAATGFCVGAGLWAAMLRPGWMRNLAFGLAGCVLLASHLRTAKEWREAGNYSAAVVETVRAQAAMGLTQETTLYMEVGEVHRGAFLWAWSAPFMAGPPFIPRKFNFSRVFSRTASYYQPDNWSKHLDLTKALRTSDTIILIRLKPDGTTMHRRASRADAENLFRTRPDLATEKLTMEQFFQCIDALMPPER